MNEVKKKTRRKAKKKEKRNKRKEKKRNKKRKETKEKKRNKKKKRNKRLAVDTTDKPLVLWWKERGGNGRTRVRVITD